MLKFSPYAQHLCALRTWHDEELALAAKPVGQLYGAETIGSVGAGRPTPAAHPAQ